ncbi:hypothetical protein VSAK1_02534, partial [Vibrio mediterranei AK1]
GTTDSSACNEVVVAKEAQSTSANLENVWCMDNLYVSEKRGRIIE